jgi:outer membrane protein
MTLWHRWKASRSMACASGALLLAGCWSPGSPFALESFPEAASLGTTEPDDAVAVDDALRFEQRDQYTAPTHNSNGALELSIEQAVLTALRNNRGLQVEQLQPMIVGTFEQIELARFDPVVSGDVVFLRNRRQQLSAATREAFGLLSEQVEGRVGVTRELPSGTEFGVSLSHQFAESDRVPGQHSPRAGLTLTQALLRGADWDANVASIRQARLDTVASVYELRGFAEQLVADVERTYWDYLLAEREIEIFESSLELARQQLDETTRRVEVGTVAETELSAARAEVAQRREELINARSTREHARLRLLRLVNPNSESHWHQHIELIAPPDVLPEYEADVEDHLRLARLMRPEINEARLRLEQGRLEVIRTRDGLLPRLDFFLVLGKSGYARTFGDSVRDIDGRGYDLQAGLEFSYPIGNRAAQADHQRARLSRQQATQSLHNLTQLVEMDILLAMVDVERAREQITATQATRTLREEALRAETEKFRIGTSTAFLVAQAQRDMLESQIAEVRAAANYRQARVELYRLEGTLLQRRAIAAPGSEIVRARATVGQ